VTGWGINIMVLAAAQHALTAEGVYLFAPEFPDYNRRMEVIAFMARMHMLWDCGLTLA